MIMCNYNATDLTGSVQDVFEQIVTKVTPGDIVVVDCVIGQYANMQRLFIHFLINHVDVTPEINENRVTFNGSYVIFQEDGKTSENNKE